MRRTIQMPAATLLGILLAIALALFLPSCTAPGFNTGETGPALGALLLTGLTMLIILIMHAFCERSEFRKERDQARQQICELKVKLSERDHKISDLQIDLDRLHRRRRTAMNALDEGKTPPQ